MSQDKEEEEEEETVDNSVSAQVSPYTLKP
jgi:hypothetical protein